MSGLWRSGARIGPLKYLQRATKSPRSQLEARARLAEKIKSLSLEERRHMGPFGLWARPGAHPAALEGRVGAKLERLHLASLSFVPLCWPGRAPELGRHTSHLLAVSLAREVALSLQGN